MKKSTCLLSLFLLLIISTITFGYTRDVIYIVDVDPLITQNKIDPRDVFEVPDSNLLNTRAVYFDRNAAYDYIASLQNLETRLRYSADVYYIAIDLSDDYSCQVNYYMSRNGTPSRRGAPLARKIAKKLGEYAKGTRYDQRIRRILSPAVVVSIPGNNIYRDGYSLELGIKDHLAFLEGPQKIVNPDRNKILASLQKAQNRVSTYNPTVPTDQVVAVITPDGKTTSSINLSYSKTPQTEFCKLYPNNWGCYECEYSPSKCAEKINIPPFVYPVSGLNDRRPISMHVRAGEFLSNTQYNLNLTTGNDHEIYANPALLALLDKAQEIIYKAYGKGSRYKIAISSGCRFAKANKAVGGTPTSVHQEGRAADISGNRGAVAQLGSRIFKHVIEQAKEIGICKNYNYSLKYYTFDGHFHIEVSGNTNVRYAGIMDKNSLPL